jgi:hypothetical protein
LEALVYDLPKDMGRDFQKIRGRDDRRFHDSACGAM